MKNSILIAAIAALTVYACKDKNKDQVVPSPKSSQSAKQTLLIGKAWKIKNFVFEGTDVTPELEECLMDNTMYYFKNTTKGFYDEGATKCDPADPQKGDFTWKFENNETKIIVTTTDGNDTLNILNLTSSELRLSMGESVLTLKN